MFSYRITRVPVQLSIYAIPVLFNIHNNFTQVKEDEMDRKCSTSGEKRNAYRILLGKPKGKRTPQDGMNWVDMAQDRDQWRALMNTVTNLQVL
jgi:hypothetical protein